MEPATKKPKLNTSGNAATETLHLTCEHIHIDTSIYDELISSPNSRFIINNNKWLIINMQYIWEFIPTRVKFIKRTEVPSSDALTRLFQVVSDEENNQVIFLGLSAFYVLSTDSWKWTQYDNIIKAPINVPYCASGSFIFSYDNDKLFRGTLPFNGDLEKIETLTRVNNNNLNINFPWSNSAVLYYGHYYFINAVHEDNVHIRFNLFKLCMTNKEFVDLGQIAECSHGTFVFGCVRENKLYFVSSNNELLIISKFGAEGLDCKVLKFPPTPFLRRAVPRYIGDFPPLHLYFAFDGTNLVLFDKRQMTFLTLDLDTYSWSEPIIFEDYPPPLLNHINGKWIPWKNTGLLITGDLSAVFLFDSKTWTWTTKHCFHQPNIQLLHGAIHEDRLYVCGRPHESYTQEKPPLEFHCLDLKTWIWTKPPSLDYYGWSDIASIVVVDNTLYLIGAYNSYKNKLYDWAALNLETKSWTKSLSASNTKNLTHHIAGYCSANHSIYMIHRLYLATLSLHDNKLSTIDSAFVGAQPETHLTPCHEGLLLIGGTPDGIKLFSRQVSTKKIRFLDTTTNSFKNITWKGDEHVINGPSLSVQLNGEVFVLNKYSKTMFRYFKDAVTDVQVKSLQHLATTALCGYLDMDNVFTLLDYSVNLRNRVLQQGCIVFLKNNTLKLMQRIDEINQLSPEIKDILAATFTYLPIGQ